MVVYVCVPRPTLLWMNWYEGSTDITGQVSDCLYTQLCHPLQKQKWSEKGIESLVARPNDI